MLAASGGGRVTGTAHHARHGPSVLLEEALTRSGIGAFFDVYNEMGYGYLAQLYAVALATELRERGHRVAREGMAPVFYKGREIGRQRLDLVVNEVLVAEIESSAALSPTGPQHLLNYLGCADLEVGLLLHFGPEKAAFERLVHPRDPRNPRNPRNPRSPRPARD